MSGAEEVKQAPEAMQEEAAEEQDAEQPSNKRKPEEAAAGDGAAGEGDAQPPAKVQKTEGDEQVAGKEGEAAAKAPQEPVTIGYRTFATGKQCYDYFHSLMTKLRKYQNLNDVGGKASLHMPPPLRRCRCRRLCRFSLTACLPNRPAV